MVALCLSVNAARAKDEYKDTYSNYDEYGDWTEVTDGTKKTTREHTNEAMSYAWDNAPDVRKHTNDAMSYAWSKATGVRKRVGAYLKGSGTGGSAAQIAPVQKSGGPPVGSAQPSAQGTGSDDATVVKGGAEQPTRDDIRSGVEHGKGHSNGQETVTVASPQKVASDRESAVSSDRHDEQLSTEGAQTAESPTDTAHEKSRPTSKPTQKRNKSDGSGGCKMHIGHRMSKHEHEHDRAECNIENMRALIANKDEHITVYRSEDVTKNKSGTLTDQHKRSNKEPGVTAEMLCLWNYLLEKVRSQEIRSNRYAMCTNESTGKSIRLDMVSDETLLYTEKKSNQIVLVNDNGGVEVAEVLVKTGTGTNTYNRIVIYTERCLRLADSVKLNGTLKVKREVRILIFCLLVVTGWGFYANANETTQVSYGGWTARVKQGDHDFTMFHTKTEFTLTNTEAGEADQTEEVIGPSKYTTRSTTVSQIATRTSKHAQPSTPNNAMTLRSNGKQRAENEPHEAPKAAEAAKAANQAVNKNKKTADKKASDTEDDDGTSSSSSSSSSDGSIANRTRSKSIRRSARLRNLQKQNKNKIKSN